MKGPLTHPRKPGCGRKDMPAGPGRPKGSKGRPPGVAAAEKVLAWRVPHDATQAQIRAAVAARLFLLDALAGKISGSPAEVSNRLKAATTLLADAVTPHAQRVEGDLVARIEVVTGIDRDLDERPPRGKDADA